MRRQPEHGKSSAHPAKVHVKEARDGVMLLKEGPQAHLAPKIIIHLTRRHVVDGHPRRDLGVPVKAVIP